MNFTATNPASRLTAVIIAAAAPDTEGATNPRERLTEHLAWTLAHFPFRHFAVIATSGNGGHRSSISVSTGAHARPIARALRELPGGLFVATGDMPFISTDMVDWLLGHDDSEVDAVVPRHAQGVEPLFAIYNPSFLAHLEVALAEPGDALLNALDTSRVRYVETSDGLARSFARVETEEACARALAGLEKKFSDPSRL